MHLPDLKQARIRTNYKPLIKEYRLEEKYKNIGNNKKYFIRTYGCQMNEHDSENIKAMMESLGYILTDILEEANVVILNTCAIRENVHNKVFGYLGRIKHLRETKDDIITCVCGCMAQEENVANEIKNKYKWVDIVFGTHNLDKLPEFLYGAINEKIQQIEVYSIEGDIVECIPAKRDSKYKAWINIMYGCDKFCTYCIVPYTRGKQRSREKESILKEVNDLLSNGYKEVTLLGQNVNAYGKDLYDDYDMCNLLEDVAKTNIERIRFVTSHPWDFTDKMIEIIAKYPNIMPYIHLPLQSGSNRILKLMGRRYTKEDYLTLFHKLKSNIPNVSITTDIIVGFPNETDEDFNDTLDIVNECKYDSAFTFIFSPRVGTPASRMEDNVSKEAKEKRLYLLNNLVNEYALMNNKKYVNRVVPVLIEGNSEKGDSLFGYTDTMKLVNVTGDCKIGNIVDIKITDAKTWSLDGTIVDKNSI
ncbi:MAG: tRNA (N6-isopentenyl adenosine(37)-C2)-methylthiotransferase MiaB [Bacilli bacterium]|nr:tRNA (N6-isopentenyl adenosine(37)-C2)-methylthiotransferase MiaB [Bacilli bacterium]